MQMQGNAPRMKLLARLFVTMLYISAFTFGGGYVIVTFMKKKFVDEFHWIDEKEMLALTALAQSTPGAIAVNAAIMVGWRVGGFGGMLSAVLGTIIPPVAIISILSLFYAAFAENPYVALVLQGMQAGVAAVILDVVWNMGSKVVKGKSWLNNGIMVAAFAATFVFKVNVMYIILAAILIGVVKVILMRKEAAK